MNLAFDCLIDSYIAQKIGIATDFLSQELAALLKGNLMTLQLQNQLVAAGIGQSAGFALDLKVRADKIYWLDRAHQDPHENSFFDLMDDFVRYLNSSCYTGITGYEFHYTYYQKGAFYKRHLDQFHHNKNRAFSIILYLNADWKETDGGELCVFLQDKTQIISPQNGKCVFFKSNELEHEVLVTQVPRLSITGWFKTN